MQKTQIIIVILAILISIVKLQASTFTNEYDANGNKNNTSK